MVPVALLGNTSHGHHPRLCCAMDPNMVHSSSKGLALQAGQATQFGMVLVAARPSDTNMVTGGGPDLWHQAGLRWYQEQQTSTQTLAVVEP